MEVLRQTDVSGKCVTITIFLKEINNILPDWISRQATLGANVEVDGKRTDDNYFWFLLTVCCPLIFESYAIILHPFWINFKAKKLVDSGLDLKENQLNEEDFKRVSWANFFKLYGYDFTLKTANQTQEKIRQRIIGDYSKKLNLFDKIRKMILKNSPYESTWPIYLWYPGEGELESEELKYVFSTLTNLYGDINANFYYNLLKTQDWSDDKIYNGKLFEFKQLSTIKNLQNNPTAIYPDNKSWCIVSDYDLPFTYIGGESSFINSLTKNGDFDIFKIEPLFKEKKENHTSR